MACAPPRTITPAGWLTGRPRSAWPAASTPCACSSPHLRHVPLVAGPRPPTSSGHLDRAQTLPTRAAFLRPKLRPAKRDPAAAARAAGVNYELFHPLRGWVGRAGARSGPVAAGSRASSARLTGRGGGPRRLCCPELSCDSRPVNLRRSRHRWWRQLAGGRAPSPPTTPSR